MTPFLSDILAQEGWEGLFQFAKRQSLVGVVWDEVQVTLEPSSGIPSQILRQWATLVGKIEERNKLTDEVAERVAERFAKDGFCSIILKGQGLCHYYPEPLHRQSGDIDIWIWRISNGKTLSQRRDDIVAYVLGVKPKAKVCYHHIEFKKIKGIDIEVHFTPTWMYSPRKNRILQRYFQEYAEITLRHGGHHHQQSGMMIPDDEFNLVFILIHIYRHIFDEGVGLRQMMDYDMLLRHSSESDKRAAMQMISKLGLLKFTAAVMFVLHKVFNTDKEILLTESDADEGQWLYRQIMDGGNFGHHKRKDKDKLNDGHSTHLNNFINRIRRSSQLVFHYPEEAFWTIPWRIWHWNWRLRKGYL